MEFSSKVVRLNVEFLIKKKLLVLKNDFKVCLNFEWMELKDYYCHVCMEVPTRLLWKL